MEQVIDKVLSLVYDSDSPFLLILYNTLKVKSQQVSINDIMIAVIIVQLPLFLILITIPDLVANSRVHLHVVRVKPPFELVDMIQIQLIVLLITPDVIAYVIDTDLLTIIHLKVPCVYKLLTVKSIEG